MLIAFFISLLGFAFAHRISRELIRRNLFASEEMTKIGTIYFAMVFVMLNLVPHRLFALWLGVFVPLLLLMMCLALAVRRRLIIFRAKVKETLSLILLKMKAGKSFRLAFSEVIGESESSLRVKLSEIFSVVAFSQQQARFSDDSFIREVIIELKKVDQNPHSAIRMLTVFRDKLRFEDEFRHKSGQVLARIRIQSLVMVGLYLAVATFMVIKFGWRSNAQTIVSSAFLFLLGSVWIWVGGRNLKWKV